MLGAAHDWICAPQYSQIIAERIPKAHLKIFANSGHMLANDENAAYLQRIKSSIQAAVAKMADHTSFLSAP